MGTITFAGTSVSGPAREGMTAYIYDVRRKSNASTADFTIAGTTYWSDLDIQAHLDATRTDLRRVPLNWDEEYDPAGGGSLVYLHARCGWANFEQSPGTAGTSLLRIEDSLGSALGTSVYTVDYTTGVITFSSDQDGTAYYLTGRSYDTWAAAARIWREKAGVNSDQADFKTDNTWWYGSQRAKQCMAMAEFAETQSAGDTYTVTVERYDWK